MAAYYHTHGTADIPDHGLHHTLILMNPNFSGPGGYTDPQPPPSHNVLLLNSAAAAAATSATTAALPHPLHHQFAARGHQLPPQQENITLYGYPQSEPARELTRSGSRQGLSLSLSSSQNPPYGHGHPVPPSEGGEVADGGPPGSILGSKYLKAAQELLEEVVHVGDGLLFKTTESSKKTPASGSGSAGKGAAESPEEKHGGGGDGGAAQLSSAERQELQMKKAKLVTMLDEAEQRYRQYHHQMQIVIASFEQAAGVGSAKTYTALALKTISKQFRCLKDAIQAQIRAASKSLGEESEGGGGGGGSSGGNKLEGSSRLKYIDHQIRQQRALQQLGMIQNHNAWRPQRGLPERSVSVLRAWLFEHFLHPYPKDSDKIMLAKQTGLTRSQVSNWFINARVRLWKPMIEEMYTEEIKEQELQNNNNNNGSQEQKTAISSKENSNVSNSGNTDQEKLNIYDQIQATTPNNKATLKDQNVAVSSFNNNNNMMLEMEGISQGSPKRPRNAEVLHNCDGNNHNREIFIKFGSDKQGRESNDHGNSNNNGYPMISGGMNFVGGGNELSSYPTIGEIGRFGTEEFPAPRFLPGNGISLSLGLPPCENHHQQQLNLSATNHTFLSPNPTIQFRRADHDFGSINNPSSHSQAAGFECIDIQNRKGFAAQLLPDFVVN